MIYMSSLNFFTSFFLNEIEVKFILSSVSEAEFVDS